MYIGGDFFPHVFEASLIVFLFIYQYFSLSANQQGEKSDKSLYSKCKSKIIFKQASCISPFTFLEKGVSQLNGGVR